MGFFKKSETSEKWLFLACVFLGLPFSYFMRDSLSIFPFFSRLGVADFFIAGFCSCIIWSSSVRIVISWDVILLFLLNFGMLLSVLLGESSEIFSEYGFSSEIIIHFYLFIFYVCLRSVLQNTRYRKCTFFGLMVGFLASVLIEFLRQTISLTLWDSSGTQFSSSFLNYGQYGGFLLAVAIPFVATFMASDYFNQLFQDEPQTKSYLRGRFLIFLSVLPLLYYTSKRSALIGMIVAMTLCFLGSFLNFTTFRINFRKFILGGMIVVSLFFIKGLFSSGDGTEGIYLERINFVFETMSGQAGPGFIESNWGQALEAFFKNPILGKGLNSGFEFNNEIFEVHSTYLKWLGQGGLVVFIPGCLLIFGILFALLNAAFNAKGSWRRRHFMEFCVVVGLCVSMMYHYHFRNRETMVVLALFVSGTKLSTVKI